jgi:hypothetical protein
MARGIIMDDVFWKNNFWPGLATLVFAAAIFGVYENQAQGIDVGAVVTTAQPPAVGEQPFTALDAPTGPLCFLPACWQTPATPDPLASAQKVGTLPAISQPAPPSTPSPAEF